MNYMNFVGAMLLGGLLTMDTYTLDNVHHAEQQKTTIQKNAKYLAAGAAVITAVLASCGMYYYVWMLPKVRIHEQEQEAFSGALFASNFAEMNKLLAEGKRLDPKYLKKGGNLLHEVIQRGPHEGSHPTGIPSIQAGVLSVIKHMGSEIDLNQPNARGVTPLFAALHEIQRFPNNQTYVDEQLGVIDILIAEGVDKNSIGSRGLSSAQGSLLHAAACIDKNHETRDRVIKHLLYTTGVDQYIQDPDFHETFYALLPK